MTTWHRRRGDINDTITVTLDGVAALTGAAVEAHVQHTNRRTPPVTLTAAVDDPAERTVIVQLGDGTGWLATAEPGTWRTDFEVTWPDGRSLTWPAKGHDQIVVGPSLDP